ncbi:hypothetical protein BJ322DRAFT_1020710 [Thelephora terrestris]|uniref:Thiaminase-2/PQQC domain-containing protein n=1 Tax=Thelephora terrestris TaxID=56493 RepID=A0A9P6HEK5_9AGAM|nr:hypothetical protein BJ322DRAFT_1020710 [Thelephora terrestris]
MPTPFIDIPHSSPISGRARDFLGEINRVVADPNLGASLEQIKEGANKLQILPGVAAQPDPKDLVGRLINDNQDLWNKLLNNPFCMKMKQEPKENQAVLNGFKWYMRQDFLYCVKLMTYEADRSIKALSSANFIATTQRVKDNADYSGEILKTCTDPPPTGLGIPELTVLQTRATLALLWYNQFQILCANTTNWAVSMAAMVPCIQAYYLIGKNLKDNSAHKDTPWYVLWAVPNADDTYAIDQKNFFIQNYDQWKDQYDKANEIFQLACNGEINLWATALNPEAL